MLDFTTYVERITAILLFRHRITCQEKNNDGCLGPNLFLPQFLILRHFALTPLTNLHHFVIYDLSFWVYLSLFGVSPFIFSLWKYCFSFTPF